MGKQKKLSSMNGLSTTKKANIGRVLDLEKKYQSILWEIFTSPDFVSDLKHIEDYIKTNYISIKDSWALKNILKTGAERVARYHIYFDLPLHHAHVKGIYPSPISGDIGLILNDVVLSIDVKTLDTVGNRSDINYLQFLPNQSSFVNKNLDSDINIPKSGVKVDALLPFFYLHENIQKPILTYFLTIIYSDDGVNFSLCRNTNYGTIHLCNLPNGDTSVLYDFDLVTNFKTYDYFDKNPYKPILLIRNCDLTRANEAVIEYQRNHPNLELINGRSKLGLYDPIAVNPRYHTKGVSWFPVSRKVRNSNPTSYDFYLNAVKMGNTSRITKEILKDRFDSKDQHWEGNKIYKL